MEKQPSPPGAFLAAGSLIGTGIATLALLVPSLPSRLAESPFTEGLAVFDLALDALSLVFGIAMLVCAVGIFTRRATFVTWSLALVVVHGLFQLAGATLEKTLFDGTATLLVLRLVFAIATGILCFVPLLIAYLVLERRRYALSPTARRSAPLLVVEGIAAFFFLGASFVAMASYSSALAALARMETRGASADAPAEAPEHGRTAAGAPAVDREPPPAPESRTSDDDAESAAPASFRRSLASVSGGHRPLWEKGASVTVVNFWASWCGPCLYELPQLQRIQDKFSRNGVKIMLVNVDLDEPESVRQFLNGRAISLNSLVDRDGETFHELGLRALPSMFLLDAEGRPVRSYVGAVDQHSLEHEILTVLQSAANVRSRSG